MSTSNFAAARARIAARRADHIRDHGRVEASSPRDPLERIPLGLRGIAESSLAFYTTLQSSSGTRPAFRVGQVDAELLDEELLGLLKSQVGDGLKYLGSHIVDDWGVEISSLLRAVLWKLSIWDRSASYGASLQGLRYVDARRDTTPSRWQKAGHGIFTVAGHYGWQKWESWLSRNEEHDRPSTTMQRMGALTKWLGTIHESASLLSFLVFLYNGRYRTLSDRLLRLRLAPTPGDTTRQVSFEFLNRQLVWHAFTEFLLFVLPLVGVSRWKRILGRIWNQVKRTLSRQKTAEDEHDVMPNGELGFLPERTCAICYKDQSASGTSSGSDAGGVVGSAQTDVTNPYEAEPCGCVYCFVCVTQVVEAAEGHDWTCLRCGEPTVTACRPWNGDIVQEVLLMSSADEKRMSRKSVVFADDDDATEHSGDERDEKGRKRLSVVDPIPLDHNTSGDSRHEYEGGQDNLYDHSRSCSEDGDADEGYDSLASDEEHDADLEHDEDEELR